MKWIRDWIPLWIVLWLVLSLGGCSFWKLQPPSVTHVSLQAAEGNLFEQRFILQLRVQNPNSVEIPITELNFELYLNDQLFATGVSAQPLTLTREGETLAEIIVVSDLASLIRQALKQPSLAYLIKGRLVTDVIFNPHFEFENRGIIEMPFSFTEMR